MLRSKGRVLTQDDICLISKDLQCQLGLILNDKKVQAPIWIGEFDTCNQPEPKTWYYTYKTKTANLCVSNKTAGTQGQWFQIFMKYLHNNPEISWAYYPFNVDDKRSGLNPQTNSNLGCPVHARRIVKQMGPGAAAVVNARPSIS